MMYTCVPQFQDEIRGYVQHRSVKRTGYTWAIFCHFNKGENFCDFLFCFPAQQSSSERALFCKERICSEKEKGSTLEERNLLPKGSHYVLLE